MGNVIHIFGASGSGTTTLGKRLCEELGYVSMDSDNYFWLPTDPPFTTRRPAAERVALMQADIERCENVVISGSLVDWGDPLIPYFTLAVRIEMEPAQRLARLKLREQGRYGARIDPGGDMHQAHLEFMDWAAQYDTGDVNMRSKAKHDLWQTQLNCRILRVNGADELDVKLKQVLDALKCRGGH